jgi:tetratricopeptide (TPR) repeat protein
MAERFLAPCPNLAMWHRLRIASVIAGLLASATVPPSPAVAQEVIEPDAAAVLASGWSAFFDREPFSAAAAVEKLTRSPRLGEKLHALHVKARSLWLAGDPANQNSAQALGSQLAREGQGDPYATARTETARGLGFAASGQNAKAIATLEQVFKQNLPSSVTIEAAIDLALLYAEADRIGDATATLDHADKILDYPEGIGLDGKLQKAFAKGVKRAREWIASKGRALFDLARGMQRESQYAKAIVLFNKVSEEYPETDYGPRSQFEVGECLFSMNRQDEAVKHWDAFVAAAPAGPWRGQAFVRLVDVHLAERLDLTEAERYALLAKTGMTTALGQNIGAANGGWPEAAFGLHLRIGMIALCRDQHPAAAETFEQARAAEPDKAASERLAALAKVASDGGSIIPADCRGAAAGRGTTAQKVDDAGRVPLALALGMMHHVAGLEDLAGRYFARVTGSPAVSAAKGGKAKPAMQPLAGAAPAQLAFAWFGKGAVLEANKKTKDAKDAFLASLKTSNEGTWHDETLFRVATIIEAEAESRAGKDDQRHVERAAAIRAARAEAMPYWQEIVTGFPDSPRHEVAMYRAAILAYERAETASASAAAKPGGGGSAEAKKQVEKAWTDAAKQLGAFTEAYPESEYAGDAYVRQIDLALERLFDLERAGTLGPLAAAWAKAGPRTAKAVQLTPWARPVTAHSAEQAAATRRDCLMLAGLTAYLAERYDEAVQYVTAAGPETPPAGFTKDYDIRAIGLHFLLEVIRAKKPVTDPLALDAATNSSQRMALQLGGLYLASVRPDRGEAVFRRIIEKEPKLGAIPMGVEAYALLKLAITLDRQPGRQKEGVEILEQLAERTDLRGTVWGGTALFRYALYTFNVTGDAAKSLPLYQRFLREYPAHPSRELASYYAFADACKLGDRPMAMKMAEDFRTTYPKSMWIQSIDERLLQLPPEGAPNAEP